MNKAKVVRAEVFLDFMENAEATIEVLSSEIPIDTPRRQRIEMAVNNLRAHIAEFREKLQAID